MHTPEPTILPLPKRRRPLRERASRGFSRLSWQLYLQRHWWLARHTPYQPFFLIGAARTGSNLLMEYLNQIPSVHCLSEILNWLSPIAPRRRSSSAAAMRHVRRWLHVLQTAHRGCKLFFKHLDNFGLQLSDLEEAFPGAKYIVLYRESLAEQYVSLQLAQMTQQWRLLPGEQRTRLPVTIDPADLKKFCDEKRSHYQQLLTHPAIRERGTVLSYEELVADPARSMQEHVCSLLGVPPVEPQAPLRKQNPEPLSSRIANYASVAALIASPLCQQRHLLHRRTARRRAA